MKTSRSRKRGWALAGPLVLAGGIYIRWPKFTAARAREEPKGDRDGKQEFGAAIPAVAICAHGSNIGVYDTELGAVTPIYTVNIQSGLDGESMNVHYLPPTVAWFLKSPSTRL
jgi:hypothetical protein